MDYVSDEPDKAPFWRYSFISYQGENDLTFVAGTYTKFMMHIPHEGKNKFCRLGSRVKDTEALALHENRS
ncbi:hypothetical protein PLUA15_190095 [Pseudomonas lundensis]|uniref:Uncharacterized protein n=1 Tax=Pseudomonas lundensis TaxID=86185 RepID=A0AAX2H432_9PSED|nr:hypothetical protein PLUA15_190095 [Pseudomonas lundensis]